MNFTVEKANLNKVFESLMNKIKTLRALEPPKTKESNKVLDTAKKVSESIDMLEALEYKLKTK